MDPSQKGGTKYASFDREDASKHVDGWSKLRAEVIENIEVRTAAILKALPPLDLLLLNEHFRRIGEHIR